MAKYSADDLKRLGAAGKAFKNPDGSYSYPIDDGEDLNNAIHAVGRGGADHNAIRRYIIRRAKALGMSDKIPDNWNSDGSLRAAEDVEERRVRAELLRGREVRRVTTPILECRGVGDKISVRGYGSTTGQAYDMGWYQESVNARAFDKTLSEAPDVQLLINHEGLPLARTTNESLQLGVDTVGLEFKADMSARDPDAARVAAKIEDGLITECSFAFRTVRQSWDDDYENRELLEVSLHRGDVSIVNYGANPNTSVGFRALVRELTGALTDEQIDEIRKNLAPDEARAALETLQRIVGTPEVVAETTEAPEKRRSLDVYRAQAVALSLRK